MLRELRVSELRYRAVLEVLDGAVISTVARRYGVSRQIFAKAVEDALVRSGARTNQQRNSAAGAQTCPTADLARVLSGWTPVGRSNPQASRRRRRR